MYIIHQKENSIEKVSAATFSELNYKERENLQEWIANTPGVFDEVAGNYSGKTSTLHTNVKC